MKPDVRRVADDEVHLAEEAFRFVEGVAKDENLPRIGFGKTVFGQNRREKTNRLLVKFGIPFDPADVSKNNIPYLEVAKPRGLSRLGDSADDFQKKRSLSERRFENRRVQNPLAAISAGVEYDLHEVGRSHDLPEGGS